MLLNSVRGAALGTARKVDVYAQLVQSRKRCTLCQEAQSRLELNNPATYSAGAFDSGELGPWTRWQGNLDAEILIVGQDWGGTDDLENHGGCEPPDNPTNTAIAGFLRALGLDVDDPPSSYDTATGRFGRHGTVFLTNAILCIKSGDIQATVTQQWFTNCGPKFLRPTIELIDPLVVVTLGGMAAHGIQVAYGLQKRKLKEIFADPSPTWITDRVYRLPLYHPSWKTWRFRSREQQTSDWRRIAPISDEVKRIRQQRSRDTGSDFRGSGGTAQ
ncbi:MAG: uracil-DNA glycosylase family protein [Planctomycetes bacterium]|nr:uracil-DNA glycosylase family protein [Planctomycetota bacterium]